MASLARPVRPLAGAPLARARNHWRQPVACPEVLHVPCILRPGHLAGRMLRADLHRAAAGAPNRGEQKPASLGPY
eukprot:scaffold3420_cov134-Pinguiococcus_pyrenoidosus.AAC.1